MNIWFEKEVETWNDIIGFWNLIFEGMKNEN